MMICQSITKTRKQRAWDEIQVSKVLAPPIAGPQQSTLHFRGAKFPVQDQKRMLIEAIALGNLPLSLFDNSGLGHMVRF